MTAEARRWRRRTRAPPSLARNNQSPASRLPKALPWVHSLPRYLYTSVLTTSSSIITTGAAETKASATAPAADAPDGTAVSSESFSSFGLPEFSTVSMTPYWPSKYPLCPFRPPTLTDDLDPLIHPSSLLQTPPSSLALSSPSLHGSVHTLPAGVAAGPSTMTRSSSMTSVKSFRSLLGPGSPTTCRRPWISCSRPGPGRGCVPIRPVSCLGCVEGLRVLDQWLTEVQNENKGQDLTVENKHR
ncbi:uncharacterized protein LOC126991810 [Eriocheir sinensis]|uniref:uncharacterized protein LOC126991810 n=1 Tax=Eriocheir sinensis TaxID=95602 RepID=UPI0021C6B595|nr:uncharacterized protein LOC126991810 [Eriocheir sinensis]